MATGQKQQTMKVCKMADETGLKILLLGPITCGKTAIANFLSNSTESFAGEYRPTKGVRIVEFVAQGVRGKGVYQNSVDVELWDCSGDNRYQSCWPAVQHKTDGIIFVYSENSNSQKTELEMLHGFFVEESNFPDSCCLVVKNEFGDGTGNKNFKNPLPNLSHTIANLEDRGADFRRSFSSFLSGVIKTNLND